MENKTIFADGVYFKPNENDGRMPQFIIGKLSIKLDKFKPFVNAHPELGEWVNVDIKRAKNGTVYAQLNTWKPSEKTIDGQPIVEETINVDDVPF
jgi:hypothetical protein